MGGWQSSLKCSVCNAWMQCCYSYSAMCRSRKGLKLGLDLPLWCNPNNHVNLEWKAISVYNIIRRFEKDFRTTTHPKNYTHQWLQMKELHTSRCDVGLIQCFSYVSLVHIHRQWSQELSYSLPPLTHRWVLGLVSQDIQRSACRC